MSSVEQFGTYETIIVEMITDVGTPKVGKKRKRKVSKASQNEQGEGLGQPS